MTAKEQLRHAIDELTEAEAEDALEYLAPRQRRDALTEFLDRAPLDDEPTSESEERAVQLARDEIAGGQAISLERLKRELR